MADRRLAESTWHMVWQVSDDLGNTYQQTLSQQGGPGVWVDFSIDYQPPTPGAANQLTLATRAGADVTMSWLGRRGYSLSRCDRLSGRYSS